VEETCLRSVHNRGVLNRWRWKTWTECVSAKALVSNKCGYWHLNNEVGSVPNVIPGCRKHMRKFVILHTVATKQSSERVDVAA
jgi:hypothetical protein